MTELNEEKIVRVVITPGQKPTEEQRRELEEASKRPVVPDEESPELTEDVLKEMVLVRGKRK